MNRTPAMPIWRRNMRLFSNFFTGVGVGVLVYAILIHINIFNITLSGIPRQVYSEDCCKSCPNRQEIIVPDPGRTTDFGNTKKTGSAYRTVKVPDMPPEQQPGYDPTKPEVPVCRFPRALILGFDKCGTAALVAFLPLHPDIVTIDWEIDYFCDRMYYYYDLHWYRMRMPPSTGRQITIEKSPCYMKEPKAVDRMWAFNSSLKLMITVRHPLTRILSRYAQVQATNEVFGVPTTPLERYLKFGNGSLKEHIIKDWAVYNEQVENIYRVFPKEQIHIIDGDILISDPLDELRKIETFLGLGPYFSEQDVYFDPQKGFYCLRYRDTGQTQCLGASKGRKHANLDPQMNITLTNYLRPYNERFYSVVGRRFPWS